MKFVDVSGVKVNLHIAAQFRYKGYTVSASTILTPYASVAILDAEGELVRTDIVTVEDAILIIDTELPRL